MGHCRAVRRRHLRVPSGKASHLYTIAPGQLPADPHYHDTRVAAGGNWTLPLTRVDNFSVGAKFSAEDDFVSATADASIAHDFNDKNTHTVVRTL